MQHPLLCIYIYQLYCPIVALLFTFLWLEFAIFKHFSSFLYVRFVFLFLGRFVIGPIKPAEDGSSVKVKVKVKVDIHGILRVESAHTVTKVMVVFFWLSPCLFNG